MVEELLLLIPPIKPAVPLVPPLPAKLEPMILPKPEDVPLAVAEVVVADELLPPTVIPDEVFIVEPRLAIDATPPPDPPAAALPG